MNAYEVYYPKIKKINYADSTDTCGDTWFDNKNIYWSDKQTNYARYLTTYSICKTFYHEYEEQFEWCEKNCSGRWGYKLSEKFFFKKEGDKVAFEIKFADDIAKNTAIIEEHKIEIFNKITPKQRRFNEIISNWRKSGIESLSDYLDSQKEKQ